VSRVKGSIGRAAVLSCGRFAAPGSFGGNAHRFHQPKTSRLAEGVNHPTLIIIEILQIPVLSSSLPLDTMTGGRPAAGRFVEPFQIPSPESFALVDHIILRRGFEPVFARVRAKIKFYPVIACFHCLDRIDFHSAYRIDDGLNIYFLCHK